jgi:hypothetical protein
VEIFEFRVSGAASIGLRPNLTIDGNEKIASQDLSDFPFEPFFRPIASYSARENIPKIVLVAGRKTPNYRKFQVKFHLTTSYHNIIQVEP